MGAAIGTVAGVAATTPAAIADADPSFAPQVETASAQIAAATYCDSDRDTASGGISGTVVQKI